MKPLGNLLLPLAAAVLIGAHGMPAWAAGQTFALDPFHTQVDLSWNHFGFSNPGAAFSIGEGTLVWDEKDPAKSSVKVTISAESAHTRAAVLNDKFRTQYFEAAKHPTITFASTAVERIGLSDHYRVKGQLTIRGISKPVTLQATLNKIGEHPMVKAPAIGFDAIATVMRSDFGLGADVPFVSDEVQVRITAEGLEPAALAKMVEMVKAEAQSKLRSGGFTNSRFDHSTEMPA